MTSNLTPGEYQAIHDFLESRVGIRLGAGKEYLVVSRLARLLPTFGLHSFTELAGKLRGLGASSVQTAVVDAMTTNETLWFRDVHPA